MGHLSMEEVKGGQTMVTRYEVINDAKYLANNGIGEDADGWYGSQCVDLINYLLKKYFGIALPGNAIDLLDAAANAGLEVVYDAPGLAPKAGAFFVMRTHAHPYGHTGIVIADSDGYTMDTVEQNVDGNADYLENGGPARYRNRPFEGPIGTIIGWFYPQYDDEAETASTEEVSDEAPSEQTGSEMYRKLKDENGTMTVDVPLLNVRTEPSTSAEVVATYESDTSFKYDSVYYGDGYIWVSYIGESSGERRYVAAGVSDESGSVNVEPYGTFA